MAVNINPERDLADRGAHHSEHRAITAHLDDHYYVWRLSPGDFAPDAAAPGALIDSTGSRFGAVRLADAADQAVSFSRRRPRLWVAGRFLLDVDYTSNTAGVANFTVQTSIYAVTNTGNLGTAPILLGTGSVNWPGPTNAFDLKQYSVYSTASMTGDAYLLGLYFKRIGTTDANNNRLDIVAATLTFIPSMREVHA